MEYKVWVQIEEIDEDIDHYEDIGEMLTAGVYDTLPEAEARIIECLTNTRTVAKPCPSFIEVQVEEPANRYNPLMVSVATITHIVPQSSGVGSAIYRGALAVLFVKNTYAELKEVLG